MCIPFTIVKNEAEIMKKKTKMVNICPANNELENVSLERVVS